jgi:hypothetical protein
MSENFRQPSNIFFETASFERRDAFGAPAMLDS